jgi:hypothetical protein
MRPEKNTGNRDKPREKVNMRFQKSRGEKVIVHQQGLGLTALPRELLPVFMIASPLYVSLTSLPCCFIFIEL